MKKFAQMLTRYLDESGMKQTHVASTASISYNYLQRLLAGDRNPSDQVVYRLAAALRLPPDQTGELLAAAGFAPPAELLQSIAGRPDDGHLLPTASSEPNQTARLIQQFYRLAEEIPEERQASFLEEMRHLLGYARYKYLLSGGVELLELNDALQFHPDTSSSVHVEQRSYPALDLIAQIVGELQQEPTDDSSSQAEEGIQPQQAVEDLLSAIDRLTGNILAGEVSMGTYQPQLIVQTLDLLREGAPWEIRRRIAESLPGLCKLDVSGAQHLMEALRLDMDDVRGADVRRRVIEALPALVDASPHALPSVVTLLLPKPGDDIYVALTSAEVSGDIQARVERLLEDGVERPRQSPPESGIAMVQRSRAELASLQRQLLTSWEGAERESLQFSLALHDLLCAPDTLLLSLREGLKSSERLMRWVAIRYVERVLPSRPTEALDLYRWVLETATQRNVRRAVAKALPGLLQCLKEASLPTRTLARSVISSLAIDPDLYIRRAVADHALWIFHVDREFLLILLRQMQKETDQAIRLRLQPVALRLAQVWLVWYAETAGLVESRPRHRNALPFFGEDA